MARYDTKEQVSRLADIDPDLAEMVQINPEHPILSMRIADAQKLHHLTPRIPLATTSHSYKHTIPMRDGHQSDIWINKPPHTDSLNDSQPTPLFILIHGGGFVLGSFDRVNTLARGIASLFNITVASISYRLAPEYKFPTAAHDAWDTLMWAAAPTTATLLNIDLSLGFVLGGVSAGANLAAVVTQKYINMAKQATTSLPLPPITGLWLRIPVLLSPETCPAKYKHLYFSREQNAQALIINGADLDAVKAMYAQDEGSEDYSPFNAATPHVGMPKTYLQVCGQDPLRDDGLVYERVLRECGVETRLDVYPGVPHAHAVFFPGLESARRCVFDGFVGAEWLVGREVGEGDVWRFMEENGE